jgi:hypothetical protein
MGGSTIDAPTDSYGTTGRILRPALWPLPRICAPWNGSSHVQLDLTGKLESALGLPVDVVIANNAPLDLKMAAIRGRVIHSRDAAARLAFVERTTLQAMDTAHLRRRALRDLLHVGHQDSPGTAAGES